jgi:NADH:ubiquinone oxidoreductase subunit 5 (subunit L)/multisubunit Na+/H+ antiporter MnhA subunit
MKAMIVNRIGDFGISLSIIFIFIVFYTFNFSIIFSFSPYYINDMFILFSYEYNKLLIIILLLFLGVIGKSAQIGLHT